MSDTTARTSRPGAVSRRVALRGLGGAGLAAALGVDALGHAVANGGDRPATAMLGSNPRTAPAGDPAAVVAAYAAAVNAGDLAGILALYADDAVHVALPTADGSAGVCVGKAQFGMWYDQAVADAHRVEVVDGTLAVDGDRATFAVRIASDPWRALGIEALEANAEAVVVDGRITTHVEMLTPGSVRRLLSARGTLPAPPAPAAPAPDERTRGPR